MTIESRHIGSFGGNVAACIQVTVTDWGGGSAITEDVTDLHGFVDIELIQQLRNLADELEEQNNLLKGK